VPIAEAYVAAAEGRRVCLWRAWPSRASRLRLRLRLRGCPTLGQRRFAPSFGRAAALLAVVRRVGSPAFVFFAEFATAPATLG
jgi:hypothetical protein